MSFYNERVNKCTDFVHNIYSGVIENGDMKTVPCDHATINTISKFVLVTAWNFFENYSYLLLIDSAS